MNFKNPWAKGGEYFPDWLDGEKALGLKSIESSDMLHSTTIEKLRKVMITKVMQTALGYILDGSPTFVSFLRTFDNIKTLRGKINFEFGSLESTEIFGVVRLLYRNKFFEELTVVDNNLALDSLKLTTHFTKINYGKTETDIEKSEGKNYFAYLAESIVTIVHEIMLHVESHILLIEESLKNEAENSKFIIDGPNLLTKYKLLHEQDKDHKRLHSKTALAYRTVAKETVNFLKTKHIIVTTRSTTNKFKHKINDQSNKISRKTLELPPLENETGEAKYNLYFWELLKHTFLIDQTPQGGNIDMNEDM